MKRKRQDCFVMSFRDQIRIFNFKDCYVQHLNKTHFGPFTRSPQIIKRKKKERYFELNTKSPTILTKSIELKYL